MPSDCPSPEMKMPFFCNAVRAWRTGGHRRSGATRGTATTSPLVDAVYSSCCLPGIFEPFERDGYHYMDGGIVDRPAAALRQGPAARPDPGGGPDREGHLQDAELQGPRGQHALPLVRDRRGDHRRAAPCTCTQDPPHGPRSSRRWGTSRASSSSDVPEVVRLGEERDPARGHVPRGDAQRWSSSASWSTAYACPVMPRDYVSIRIDSNRPASGAATVRWCARPRPSGPRARSAEVRKLSNYECTRDHACARNCPTDAIHLGNL